MSTKKELVDGERPPSLTSLRLFLFFFFAGVGALLPFLPLHMRAAGLTAREARFLSAAAPLTGLLGPLLAALVLDRRRPQNQQQQQEPQKPRDNGKKLRFLLAFTVLGAALCYCALLLVPSVTWFPARRPSVSFSCSGRGAAVLQERCMEPACYRWPEHEVGPLILTNCEYECPEAARAGSGRLRTGGDVNRRPDVSSSGTSLDDGVISSERPSSRRTVQEDPPHICVSEMGPGALGGTRTCHVYTGTGAGITVNASLRQATNPDAEQDQWCNYPVAEAFSCSLPASWDASRCRVLCDIDHPYTAEGSVLAQSQCQVLVGDPALTFWSYLLVRCVADAFPAAALVMVDTAVLVAARGAAVAPLGRQVVVSLLGGALAAPLAGLFSPYPAPGPSPAGWPPYGVPILGFAACMIIAAVILMCSPGMPVAAPDWWWEPKKPGAAPRRSAGEAAALFLVLVLLGAFCSAIDSYLPWRVSGLRRLSDGDLAGSGVTPDLLLGLNVLLGVLPALPLLWRAEALVQYCGCSNILITAFTVYIIRYAGLSFSWSPWWILALEAGETFTLSVVWVTTVLYFAQLLPRRLTASGQALAVAAYFGVGRSLGALLGGLLAPRDAAAAGPLEELDFQQLRPLYAAGAAAAAAVALLYFVLHHCRPRCCRAPTGMSKQGQPSGRSVLAGQNLNGSYTPLRVYHGGGRRSNNNSAGGV